MQGIDFMAKENEVDVGKTNFLRRIQGLIRPNGIRIRDIRIDLNIKLVEE